MKTLPTAIIAVDPGLASGVALVRYGADGLSVAYSAELDPIQTGIAVRGLMHEAPDAELVVERFTITAATAKNSQAPWSLEVIGMLRWLLHTETGRDPESMIMQGPAEAKRLITNDLLKAQNLWHRGGRGHANDAIRHAAYRYAVGGWRAPWEPPEHIS